MDSGETSFSYTFETPPKWENFRSVFLKDNVRFYFGYTDNTSRLALWIQITDVPALERPKCEVLDSLRLEAFSEADKRMNVRFELLDALLQMPFLSFCRDFKILLQYAPPGVNLVGLIFRRIEDWQELLKRHHGWSAKRVKGLLTELVYLRDDLAPRVGLEAAVQAWEGPFGGDQDFLTDEGWAEVKSTVSGNNHVNISSIEQLDAKTFGRLVVISMDKASPHVADALILQKVVDDIRHGLADLSLEVRRRFEDALCVIGFDTCLEASKYAFQRKETRVYRVLPDEFPCVRQSQLPAGIDSLAYVLDLNVLEAFKEQQL